MTVVDEVQGFRYFEARDLLGFVDGTATTCGRPGHGEFGTDFIGYAGQLWVIERMLQRMFQGAPPGQYDRILDVSTAVTGTTFFVPTMAVLESLA